MWITGGRGFIGRHLARRLARMGHRVAGLGHGLWSEAEAARWGYARWVNGSVEAANLAQLARDAGSPEIIYHLAGGSSVGAAFANPHEDFRRTVVSSADLLDWMRLGAPNAKLVAVSSAAVYGAGHGGPIGEDAPTRPYSPYGVHKRMMEDLARSYAIDFGVSVAIVRLFSVYGPGLRKQLLWDLCQKLAAEPDEVLLGGGGGELRDWTHIEDIIRLLDHAARFASMEAPILNGGSGVATSVRDVAALVTRAWGCAAPIVFSGRSRPGDPQSLVADPIRLNAGGFAFAMPLVDGIADYVRWFRGRAHMLP